MSARPLPQPRSLSEAIADTLRERILRHDLAPGTLVAEGEVARYYGVDRALVRAAFKLLAHEGLLALHACDGGRVPQLGARDVEEALTLHALLGAYASGKARRPADPGWSLLTALQRLVERRLRLALGPRAAP